jgi:two-component system, sensor histidine kinase and response regulator
VSQRILVVDDEEAITRIVEANLAREGYEVTVANSGAEALVVLLQQPFDALIADIMMPEMDGFELLEAVRADEQLAALPVILLTGQTTPEYVARGYREGTDLYLTKPFLPEELLSFLRRILGTSKPQ